MSTMYLYSEECKEISVENLYVGVNAKTVRGHDKLRVKDNQGLSQLYIDLGTAKSEAPVYAFWIYFRQWTFKPLQRNPQIYNHMTKKHKHKPANNWSAENSKTHVTSMSCHPSPQYSHVTQLSGHPVLTAVNWA